MAIEAGQQLLHYRLIDKIGEGGMGVVWKAVDTSLDREVAIKLLPEAFSSQAERLARFEREAKLLASLNHANIAAVYGLHEAEGHRFIAMELVPGEDLGDRIARGPLPVDEVLRIGLQICEALETAHAHGVIHRDLKPANIRLTPEGEIKVLDFGLAKAFDVSAPSADASLSPTITSTGTLAGVILGTAAYMSPEQAHGHSVDYRADVWSFGCVMFEMLTGTRVFTGESISDTLASVLKLEPDHNTVSREVPPRVRRMLRRCLTKAPRQRLQSIGEARIVLEAGIAGTPDEFEPAAEAGPTPAGRSRTLLWIAALAATAVVALLAGRQLRGTPEPPVRKLPVRIETGTELDYALTPLALSPDGRRIAFVTERKLWIRDLGRLEAIEVPGSEGASDPFWSPDGSFLGFARKMSLFKVPAAGGQPVMITTLKKSIGGGATGLAWLADDRIVMCNGWTELLEVSANGGDARSIHAIDLETEADFHNVSPLPEGRGVLYMVHTKTGRDTLAVLAGGTQKVVFRAEGHETHHPVYSPTGHILYQRVGSNGGIWALPFSLAKLEVTGEPFLVAAEAELPSVSRDGTLAYIRGSTQQMELAWFDSDGSVLGAFGELKSTWVFPAISPDGARVAVAADAAGDSVNWDVWVHDEQRGTQTRVTFAEDEQGSIAWTADGKQLFYTSGASGAELEMHIASADASGEPRVLWDGDECRPTYDWENPHVSPDGRLLAYSAQGADKNESDICILDLSAEESKPTRFIHSPADEMAPRFHPNGRFLAYQSTESGSDEIYITTFPEGSGKWQVSTGGGNWPRWSADGKTLYYRRQLALMAVDVQTDPTVRLGAPTELFSVNLTGQDLGMGRPDGFSVSPDGRFLFVRRSTRGAEAAAAAGIVLVQNWFEEFR